LPLLEEQRAVDAPEIPVPDLPEVHPDARYGRIEWLVPVLLCVVMFGQLFLSSRRLSQTADEATHLFSGYRYLKCGDLTVSPEHPPLAKVIAAAPLLAMNLAVDCTPFKGDNLHQAFASLSWFYSQDWPIALARARAAVALFAVGLCVLVWVSARRMFGFATAVAAGVMLIFEPSVLAYGSLVMTDVPVTCMLLLTVVGFYLWCKHRTVAFFLLTCLATGLTLLTKHSGVVAGPVLVVLAIADAFARSDRLRPAWRVALRNVLAVALIGAVAAGVVWLGYGMRFAPSSAALEVGSRPAVTSFSDRVLREFEKYHLLPQAYLEGYSAALAISEESSVVSVAGKVYAQAPWFSTPFNLLIRSTGALLAMIVLAAFGVAGAFRRRRRECLFLLIPAAVYVAVCLRASSDVSVRYLLPMFPFLLIGVAAGCMELAKRVRWVRYVLPCLLGLHAASSLHAYPNYLSYANDFWGGPTQAYKYLPWVDIGQAYPQAKAYLERHPAKDCWFIAAWQWDPTFYDVPCQTLGLYLPGQMPAHVHGTVIVSSTLLRDVRLADGEIAAPFKNLAPKDEIGGSALLVYEGDFDTRLDAAASESGEAMRQVSTGHLPEALEHAHNAANLDPASPLVHANLCLVLARSDTQMALKECSTARNLLLADPLREEESRRKYLELLGNSISTLELQQR